MEHKDLLSTAREAIQALGSDTSVPAETTLESLEELQSEIESRVDALREEVGNED